MDWAQLLDDLKARGWTQALIAERCGVAQSSISELSRGKTKSPAFTLGSALLNLHKSRRSPPRVREQAAA